MLWSKGAGFPSWNKLVCIFQVPESPPLCLISCYPRFYLEKGKSPSSCPEVAQWQHWHPLDLSNLLLWCLLRAPVCAGWFWRSLSWKVQAVHAGVDFLALVTVPGVCLCSGEMSVLQRAWGCGCHSQLLWRRFSFLLNSLVFCCRTG